MHIRSVKVSQDTILISYDQANQNNRGETDVITIKTQDEPRKEFHTALQALKPHLLEILELPTGYGSGLKITSVSLATKADVTSAIIKGKKVLQNSNTPFNIITPLKPMNAGEESAGDNLLTDECRDAINEMIAEAKLFVKGERAQGLLALGNDEDEEEAEEEGEEEEPVGADEETE